MSVYYRYFRIKDEATNVLIQHYFEREREYAAHIKEIMLDIGATGSRKYNGSGKCAGFTFPKDHVVDMDIYKRTESAFLPKKNCKAGRELWKRIDSKSAPGSVDDVMIPVGLRDIAFFKGMRLYHNSLCGGPKCGYYAVTPWYDVDPKELEEYKKDNESGCRGDSELDHLLWVPPVEWEEIKEWQMKKEMDESGIGAK